MTAPITERTQSLIDYANDRRDTAYTNLTNIIENELDVDEQPPVEHIPSATLVEKAQSLIDYANGFFEDDYDNLTDIILHDLKAERVYSNESENSAYTMRKSGSGAVVGDRERDKIVGGTVAWNQLVDDLRTTTTVNGFDITNNGDGSLTVNGTALSKASMQFELDSITFPLNHVFVLGVGNTAIAVTDRLTVSGLLITGGLGANYGMWKNTQYEIPLHFRLDYEANSAYSNVKFYPQIFDLTQMFGSTIADAIYAMEQTTAGAGVAWFKALFPKPYYAYDAGSLVSVAGLKSHDTVGFNQWDEEWELGVWDTSGTKVSTSTSIRSKNYIPVIPNTSYYLKCGSEFGNGIIIRELNENKSFIATQTKQNEVFVTSGNTAFIVICSFASNNVTTYNNDICINLSDTSKNGTYEPYHKHSYPLDSSLTLRGIPKLDSENRLYYDGDTYESDGTVTRKYGVVDLGSLTWTYKSTYQRFESTTLNAVIKRNPTNMETAYWILTVLYTSRTPSNTGASPIDKSISVSIAGALYIRDEAYTDATTFTSAMNGVYLVYELAEPTTETADPFANPQIVDAEGTEQYVVESVYDVTLPVGHETKYSGEIRGIHEQEPYLLRQSGNGVKLTGFEKDKIIGGTVAWNQLQKNTVSRTSNGITFDYSDGALTVSGTATSNAYWLSSTSGDYWNWYKDHIYLIDIGNESWTGSNDFYWYVVGLGSGSSSIKTSKVIVKATASISEYLQVRITSGISVSTPITFKPQVFDLTQMFGSTIADYIYSLEQTTAGAGVAWFKALFPKDYYQYDAGSLKDIGGLQSHDMTGKNLFNTTNVVILQHVELTGDASDFTLTATGNYCYYQLSIHVIPNEPYTVSFSGISDGDLKRLYISHTDRYTNYYSTMLLTGELTDYSASFTPTEDEIRLMFYVTSSSTSGMMRIKNMQIEHGSIATTYEPYHKQSYPLDSSLTLRGIPKLDSENRLYYDGDTYESDGTVVRKYGVLTLDSNIPQGTNGIRNISELADGVRFEYFPYREIGSDEHVPLVCDKFVDEISSTGKPFVVYTGTSGSPRLYFCLPSSYNTDELIRQWFANNPTTVVYPLIDTTTETADPFTNPQYVYEDGTEGYTCETSADVILPVGHDTEY